MVLIRVMLAGLLSISVATLPIAGTAAASTNPMEMSMSDQPEMPCCPTPDDSKASVVCAFKCLNLAAAVLPAIVALSLKDDEGLSSFAGTTLYGHVVPPIHPPPI